MPDGERLRFVAPVTILATGGMGQLFAVTTNPAVTTGDGIAAAFRAGCRLLDMEFMQFHPTALYHEGSPKFLISEAVRGEGAVLRNAAGEQFMPKYHELGDLAPRDVVARAVFNEIRKDGRGYVELDFRRSPRALLALPGYRRGAARRGFDIIASACRGPAALHHERDRR